MKTKSANDFLFDQRMIAHNLRSGKITQEQLQAHLKAIEDSAQQSEEIDIDFVDATKPASEASSKAKVLAFTADLD